jgi:hypothetical protein
VRVLRVPRLYLSGLFRISSFELRISPRLPVPATTPLLPRRGCTQTPPGPGPQRLSQGPEPGEPVEGEYRVWVHAVLRFRAHLTHFPLALLPLWDSPRMTLVSRIQPTATRAGRPTDYGPVLQGGRPPPPGVPCASRFGELDKSPAGPLPLSSERKLSTSLTIRSPARPSQSVGARPVLYRPFKTSLTRRSSSAVFLPTRVLVPSLTVIGRSVFSRRVRQKEFPTPLILPASHRSPSR